MGKEIIVTVKTDTKQTDTKLKVNQNLKKTEKQAKKLEQLCLQRLADARPNTRCG